MSEDVTSLETFESPVPVVPIRPMVWSVEKYEVAQLLATKGMSIDKVSEATKVPVGAIKKWKTHPDFIKYMNDFVLEVEETLRAKRLMLYMKIVDARVEKIEELGGDYSMLSTKDTIEILEAMRKETEKADEKEQTQYMKTLEALISKSPSTIEIKQRSD